MYKLTFRTTENEAGHGGSKAKATQMNLIVMENLFYNRQFSKVRFRANHSLTRAHGVIDLRLERLDAQSTCSVDRERERGAA